MANYSQLSFKSSEIGTLMKGSLQHSSVLPTRAFSESIGKKMNNSHCPALRRRSLCWAATWVGGRVLIVKVMIGAHGGGRQSIRTPAELGPGEMNACVNEGAGWWSSCQNAKGRGWNQCREQRVMCNRKALIMASSDVGGSLRKVRSAAEKQRD
jgi:hypothetical protein